MKFRHIDQANMGIASEFFQGLAHDPKAILILLMWSELEYFVPLVMDSQPHRDIFIGTRNILLVNIFNELTNY